MRTRLIPALLLVAYSALLVQVMVFKDLPTIRIGQLMLNFAGTDGGHPANFLPFSTIVPYLFGHKGLIIAGVNLVGNIALLVPIGFLLPFVFRTASWKTALAVGGVAGLTIEVLQTVLRVGIFDIDDVILNAVGVMIGYGICRILTMWIRERKHVHMLIAAGFGIASVAGALYAIYPHGQPVVPGSRDLCGGTGGTGEIVSVRDGSFSLKRNDGVLQTITLTDRTAVTRPPGPATDLTAGDRVTVVIDESETASAVLVCAAGQP